MIRKEMERKQKIDEAITTAVKALNKAEAVLFRTSNYMKTLANTDFLDTRSPEDMARLLQDAYDTIIDIPCACKLDAIAAAHLQLNKAIYSED